jgi:ABC-type nitrate/sulfonate/bicarbonate transport system substrate-binding protein
MNTLPMHPVIMLLTLAIAVAGCSAPSSMPVAPATVPTAPAKSPAAAAGAPASTPEPTARAAIPAPVTLKAGNLRINSAAGTYLALERGYFAEQGIQLEFEPFQTGGEQIPVLASGQLDVGQGAVSAALYNAVARGVPIKLVADQGRSLPNRSAGALVVRKDLWDAGVIREPADLRGRSIGLSSTASGMEAQLDRVLVGAGLSLSDVKLTLLPYPDMAPAFANGAIDAASYQEPLTTRGIESGLVVRWLRSDEMIPDQQVGVLMYPPSLVSDVDVGRRFMVAYLRGVRDYIAAFDRGEGREEVIQVLIQHTTIKDRELYDRMIPSGLGANGHLNMRSLQDDMQWFVERGYVPQPIDLNTVVDHQFVDYALGVLGRLGS